MDSLKRTLRNIMDNLRQVEFNRVKHRLNDMGEIPRSKLETTDRDDIVDVIVQTYTGEKAGQIVLKILRELKLNQMAKDLEMELNSENSALESATTELCSLHRLEVKLFCKEDEELVCYKCRSSDVHRDHNFITISAWTLELKEKLKTKAEHLRKQMELWEEAKVTCEKTANHAERQFKITKNQIKEEFEKLHQFLRDEEAARIAAVKDEWAWKSEMMKEKIEEMSREISYLADTIRDIEGSAGADDVTFLQNYKITVERAQCTLHDPERVSGALIDVAKHLGNLKFRVWEKMQEIIQYTPVTLDPNTAKPTLLLSEDLTSVGFAGDRQEHLPNNPERFDWAASVLGSEGFNSGTHCWDVEVGENIWWEVGVTIESAQRKGSYFSMRGMCFLFLQEGKYKTESPPEPSALLTVKQKPQRIRVQLDWDRGKVTFSDPDNNTHIYTLTHTFTERVFPYFNIARNISPLRILPVKPSVKIEQFK